MAYESSLALRPSEDPVARSRELMRAHDRAVTGSPAAGVRELVASSWRRSLAAGVAPDAERAPLRFGEDALEQARQRSGLAPALGAIRSALAGLDADNAHLIAIGDREANLLWVLGDPGVVDRARSMGFEAGAAWSESAAGTNAVGTVAALDRPLEIFSAEHLVAAVHPWTCSAAPIHDPHTGELLGVIDLTADLRTANPLTLSLAIAAARAAEGALALAALTDGMPGVRPAEPLELRLLGSRPAARFGQRVEQAPRSLELLAILAMHPQGMSAEQLALAMYGERGNPVTVRAQLHRLRAHLGDGVLRAHPYRLGVAPDGDWLAVERLVATGRPGPALAAYPGKLLADSDAPVIRAARDQLDESLRRSILTTADPDLLSRWLAHSSGEADLAAARALVASMPVGDPRRAAATARSAALAHRLG